MSLLQVFASMPEKRERQSTNINKELAFVIRQLAAKEDRNFTQQIHVLLKEALAARNSDISAETVDGIIEQLSNTELAKINEKVARLLSRRLENTEIKVNGNPFADEVKKHQQICWEAWKKMPGGKRRLQEIIDGAKPTDDELGVLDACIPIEMGELLKLYQKGFGANGGESASHQECNGGCG